MPATSTPESQSAPNQPKPTKGSERHHLKLDSALSALLGAAIGAAVTITITVYQIRANTHQQATTFLKTQRQVAWSAVMVDAYNYADATHLAPLVMDERRSVAELKLEQDARVAYIISPNDIVLELNRLLEMTVKIDDLTRTFGPHPRASANKEAADSVDAFFHEVAVLSGKMRSSLESI